MGEILGFRFGRVDEIARLMKSRRQHFRPPQKKTRKFNFTAPNSRPLCELAEEVALNRAIVKAERISK